MPLVDMLLGVFERAHGAGVAVDDGHDSERPKEAGPLTGLSLLKKAEHLNEFLTSNLAPDDKKFQFTGMLQAGLDLVALKTPDTQDVQYGLFPWVAKRPISNDSFLHQLARIYGEAEETATFGFSPFEIFMMHHSKNVGAAGLLKFLETYEVNVPDIGGPGPLFGMAFGLERISLYDAMGAAGRHRLACFMQQADMPPAGVGSYKSMPVLTEAAVAGVAEPKP